MVQLGFVLVYLGFGYGLVGLVLAARRLRRGVGRSDSLDAAVASAALTSIAAFWLPAISGFPEGTLSSWAGLDPISTITAALLALLVGLYGLLPRSGDDVRAQLLASLTVPLAALVGGNAVIQTFTQRGTEAEWGLYLAAATAVLAAVTATGKMVVASRRDQP